MQSSAQSVEEYIRQVPDLQREAFVLLRKTILENLPVGFSEEMSYGMIGYVVPHSTYPNGYHCNTKLPLPFLNIAAQRNFISLYHMGIYANADLLNWFTSEYPKHSKLKLNMGKGCIRFKNGSALPYSLIAELVSKIGVSDWINLYETKIMKK
jgi:hypothetical protein